MSQFKEELPIRQQFIRHYLPAVKEDFECQAVFLKMDTFVTYNKNKKKLKLESPGHFQNMSNILEGLIQMRPQSIPQAFLIIEIYQLDQRINEFFYAQGINPYYKNRKSRKQSHDSDLSTGSMEMQYQHESKSIRALNAKFPYQHQKKPRNFIRERLFLKNMIFKINALL